MDNILFSYFRSSCSYRIRLILNFKGISYNTHAIHLLKDGGEQYSKKYKDLNPHSQVPLWSDSSLSLSQSMAIAHYLDETHPQKPIFPKDSPLRYHCIELCELINSGIQPIQNLAVLNELKSRFAADDAAVKKWVRDFISKGLQSYETLCNRHEGSFSVGEKVSAADLFLIPQLYNAHRFGVDLTSLPKIASIEEQLKQESFFIASHPDNQPDTPQS